MPGAGLLQPCEQFCGARVQPGAGVRCKQVPVETASGFHGQPLPEPDCVIVIVIIVDHGGKQPAPMSDRQPLLEPAKCVLMHGGKGEASAKVRPTGFDPVAGPAQLLAPVSSVFFFAKPAGRPVFVVQPIPKRLAGFLKLGRRITVFQPFPAVSKRYGDRKTEVHT